MTAVVLLTGLPKSAYADKEPLLLKVVVNGYDTGQVGEFLWRDGALFAKPSHLKSLGFKVPRKDPVGTGGRIPLSTLPDFTWRLDRATQMLYVKVGDQELLPVLLRVEQDRTGDTSVQSRTGATLNYDVTGTSVAGQNTGAGQFNFRLFSPEGVVSSSMLTYVNGGPGGPGSNSVVLLNNTYTYSDPRALRQYQLGDFITGGLSWTRPVRLCGIQISSDFSMQPNLITFPLPSVSGSVAVPSSINVLVNGIQLLSQQVQQGPFAIQQIPVVTGAGTVITTTTNALGASVTTTVPFYASYRLLKPGLQSFSAGIGAVRLDWGFLSNDYGPWAGSATYRRGITDALTLETHADGSGNLAQVGGGLAANIDNLGILNLSAAGSRSEGRTGTQFSAGFQRVGRVFSFGASAIFASPSFRDIAAISGYPVPTRQISANIGLSLGRYGSMGVTYAGIDSNAARVPLPIYVPSGYVSQASNIYYLQPAEHVHIVTASYSLQLGTASLYATGYHDFSNNYGSGVMVGLMIPFGRRSSVSSSVGSSSGSRYAQVQAMQSPVNVGDWGYQAYAMTGNPSVEFGNLQYKSSWGLLSAGVSQFGTQTAVQAEDRGAVAFMDGGLFASNTINDAFAVVDTNGFGNIPVMSENRLIGRTDASGQILVPNLNAFVRNKISIDPDVVPINATLPFTSTIVRPSYRSGVVVKFPIKRSHGALLRLVDAAGHVLPVGSVATLRKTDVSVPVGYDGEAYVVGLEANNQLLVERPDGVRCDVSFAYHPSANMIPTLGPLVCRRSR